MTEKELFALDISKSNDKEWLLLRNEPGVTIKTLDDIMGLPKDLYNFFYDTRELPLLGSLKREWNLRSLLYVWGPGNLGTRLGPWSRLGAFRNVGCSKEHST